MLCLRGSAGGCLLLQQFSVTFIFAAGAVLIIDLCVFCDDAFQNTIFNKL